MKYILAVLLCILLIGCNEERIHRRESTDETNVVMTLEDVKEHIESIPNPLTVETAVALGYFVVDFGELISDKSIVDDFVKHVTSRITFVYFTETGDPLVTTVVYNNERYLGIVDSRRDKNGEHIYREFKYKYLKVFEETYQVAYHLTNDPDLTFEVLMKSLASSLSTETIDQQLLIYYEVNDE